MRTSIPARDFTTGGVLIPTNYTIPRAQIQRGFCVKCMPLQHVFPAISARFAYRRPTGHRRLARSSGNAGKTRGESAHASPSRLAMHLRKGGCAPSGQDVYSRISRHFPHAQDKVCLTGHKNATRGRTGVRSCRARRRVLFFSHPTPRFRWPRRSVRSWRGGSPWSPPPA